MQHYNDQLWMRHALRVAAQSPCAGEVPIGALVVHNGTCIGEGYNQPIGKIDPSAHAEIIALRVAAQHMGNYRLNESILYVTLEPCAMCAAALIHARIARLVFGARESKTGAVVSCCQLLNGAYGNHRVEWEEGVLADECALLVQEFFRHKRKKVNI